MRPLPQRAHHAGFTLVEVLISLAIISTAIVAVVISLLETNRFAASDRNRTNAEQLCQQRIEQVLTAPFKVDGDTAAVLKAGKTQDKISIYIDSEGQQLTVPGTRTTTVEDTEGGSLKRISVEIEYVFAGRTHTMRMHSLRAAD